jgi:hypothetical protein
MRPMRQTVLAVAMVVLAWPHAGMGVETQADKPGATTANADAAKAREEAKARERATAAAARQALVEKVRPHLRPTDPKLAEQAAEEAQQPVHPGEPGKQEFWSIRHLARARFIYPPSFGFEEVPEASHYRFDIMFNRGTERGKKAASFTADKPWRPLTNVWSQLPADTLQDIYLLKVIALDAAGKELGPCKLKVGVGGGARGHDGKPSPNGMREVTWGNVDCVSFAKAPSFAGPYLDPIGDFDQAVLEMARGIRNGHGLMPPLKSDETMVKFGIPGNNEASIPMYGMISPLMLLNQLSPEAAERKEALEMAQRGADWLIRGCRNTWRGSGAYSSPLGLPPTYHGFVIHVHYTGLAYLDLYGATKDAKWLKAAEDLAQALAGLQQPNGTWTWTTAGPGGKASFAPCVAFFGLACPEFDASEILHFYGRLRKEAGCGRFAEVERRALQWMVDNSAKTFYWRDHPGNDGPHQVLGNVSPYPASYFVRYLLDWAEPTEANLKLADEIMRFVEDQWIDWSRSRDGLDTPTGSSLFAALYLKLYEKTKRPLDLAKAEALANAALRDGNDPLSLYAYAQRRKRIKN